MIRNLYIIAIVLACLNVNAQGGGEVLEGKPFRVLKLKDRDGNVIDTGNLKGKVLVLNFWFATCPPCIEEIPCLNKLYDKYRGNDQVVFASITRENNRTTDKFLKKHPFKYPIVTNAGDVNATLGINAFPTNIVVGKDGIVANVLVGGFHGIDKEIESYIKKSLKK